MMPLDLLSRRRVNFVAKVIARPSCEMARRMCFAEVVQPKGVKLKAPTPQVPDANVRVVTGQEDVPSAGRRLLM